MITISRGVWNNAYLFQLHLKSCDWYSLKNEFISFSVYGQDTFLLQSAEKPVVYSFTPKGLSDGLLHRGAYGLYFAGIFISLYGVYLMMNDKTKKCSH